MTMSAALDWIWLQQQEKTEARKWQAKLHGLEVKEAESHKPDRAAALLQARALGIKFSRLSVSKEEKERRRLERLQREQMKHGHRK